MFCPWQELALGHQKHPHKPIVPSILVDQQGSTTETDGDEEFQPQSILKRSSTPSDMSKGGGGGGTGDGAESGSSAGPKLSPVPEGLKHLHTRNNKW